MMQEALAYISLQSLLSNTLDYAGTFPPASLALGDAFRVAHGFRSKGRHSWLMAKSVLPLSQIVQTTPKQMFELGSDGSPFLFAALSSPVANGETPKGKLCQDLAAIAAFNLKHRNGPLQMEIISLETKYLGKALQSPVASDLDFVNAELAALGGSFCVFFEVDTNATNYRELARVARQLRSVRSPVGLKIRTGGERVPSSEELCAFILNCREHQLRFKATQELHYAFTDENHFGFLNLLAAINLAFHNQNFSEPQILACLNDRQASHFRFTPDSLSWMEHRMSIAEIEAARSKHWACFGSCSLDEPDEEIEKLINHRSGS